MKKMILSVAFMVAVFACEKEVIQPDISGELLSHSKCKSYAGNESIVTYYYDDSTGALNLMHINAGFNCCPDSLHCIVEYDNDTIFILEREKRKPEMALCKCYCLMDIEIVLTGVLKKSYILKFDELYAEDNIEFNIDLPNTSSGTYVVERNYYPWGL